MPTQTRPCSRVVHHAVIVHGQPGHLDLVVAPFHGLKFLRNQKNLKKKSRGAKLSKKRHEKINALKKKQF